ncbi:hypothetical protein, partial [Colwellia marinimaniae]|uniref:hypothetical protein n=1 Tax=Colwellia marinimaniae TaxID=1513592 RepID=UPI001F368CD1
MLYQLTPAASLELYFYLLSGAANNTTLINISRGIHFAFWQRDALPADTSRFIRALFTTYLFNKMVPGAGLEPARFSARDFKSLVSTNST